MLTADESRALIEVSYTVDGTLTNIDNFITEAAHEGIRNISYLVKNEAYKDVVETLEKLGYELAGGFDETCPSQTLFISW